MRAKMFYKRRLLTYLITRDYVDITHLINKQLQYICFMLCLYKDINISEIYLFTFILSIKLISEIYE